MFHIQYHCVKKLLPVISVKVMCDDFYRCDARVCYPFLEELCKLAGMSTLNRDINTICAEFLNHGQCCRLLQHVNLTDRPEVPTLGDFMHSVREVISATQFQWQGDQQDGTIPSSFWTFAVSAQWSFGSVRNSNLQHPQVNQQIVFRDLRMACLIAESQAESLKKY